MRNSFLLLICIAIVTMISCSKDEIIEENPNLIKNNYEKLNILPLNKINNSILSEQIPTSIEHVKTILKENYQSIYQEHIISDLTIDINNVFCSNNGNQDAYSFILTIPHTTGDEKLNLWSHLTFNFVDGKNISNNLVFGYYYDKTLDFDAYGKIINNDANHRYYTPKPDLPSKAPKSVICNYFSQNGNWPSSVASYCGVYGGSFGGPYPGGLEALNLLLYGNPNTFYHNVDNLYILSPSHPNGHYPFSFLSDHNGLKTEIELFYPLFYVPMVNIVNQYPNGNLNRELHVHKQAFLDSYIQWGIRLQNFAPSTNMYLAFNTQVSRDIFKIFADYNLPNNMDDGVYLNVQWGEFSSNINLSRLTRASNFLLTPAGYTLIQQYGSGTITNQQFRDILNNL